MREGLPGIAARDLVAKEIITVEQAGRGLQWREGEGRARARFAQCRIAGGIEGGIRCRVAAVDQRFDIVRGAVIRTRADADRAPVFLALAGRDRHRALAGAQNLQLRPAHRAERLGERHARAAVGAELAGIEAKLIGRAAHPDQIEIAAGAAIPDVLQLIQHQAALRIEGEQIAARCIRLHCDGEATEGAAAQAITVAAVAGGGAARAVIRHELLHHRLGAHIRPGRLVRHAGCVGVDRPAEDAERPGRGRREDARLILQRFPGRIAKQARMHAVPVDAHLRPAPPHLDPAFVDQVRDRAVLRGELDLDAPGRGDLLGHRETTHIGQFVNLGARRIAQIDAVLHAHYGVPTTSQCTSALDELVEPSVR